MVMLTLFGGWALPSKVHAQHEWDNFAIGECLILNAGDPIVKFDTSPEQISGQAYTCLVQGGELMWSDPRSGQLQFGGDLNRKFQPMAGGAINYTEGLAWGCPVPGDDSSWLILSHGIQARFSKIDMRGDSGLGAITRLNQDFAITNSVGLAVVPHSDDFHYWLITVGNFAPNSNGENVITEFDSYLIGPDGPIVPPVVSKEPVNINDFLYGSPDGSTLADFGGSDSLPGGILIFHVNQTTGKITFEHDIELGKYLWPHYSGAYYAFSPNSKVLYYQADNPNDTISYLLQYDLTRLDMSNAPYVVAESKDTDSHAFGTDMALAGNDRIYGQSNYWKLDKAGIPVGYFYSIDSPDSIGAACHFEDTAFNTGHTEGEAIWNGVPRVVHSALAQIAAVSRPSCTSSCYSFSRPDSVTGFPHWLFVGGSPATATGAAVPEVCFDSAGPHDVFAVTSAGDTLFTLVAAGTPSGAAHSLTTASFAVSPGANVTVPVELKLGYVNGGPSQTGDTIGHLLQECVIQFDTSILSLPSTAASAISLPPQDEIYSARQTGGTLTVVFEDTIGSSWWPAFGSWRDTMDKLSIAFRVTNSNNWQSSKITLARFSLDGGDGSRYDFCPVENNVLATITNASAGVASREPAAAGALRVFPNPAAGTLQILSGPAGTARLFDLLGRERAEVRDDGSGTQLDISHLEAGAYFLRMGNQSAKVEIAH